MQQKGRLPLRRRPPADLWTLAAASALGVVLVIALGAGCYAALEGGEAEALGRGPGGLGGLPQLALLAVAVLLGLPAAAVTLVRPSPGRSRMRAVLVLAGPPAVALGYFFFAHAVDPCAIGLWQPGDEVGGVPLCESTDGWYGISVRFHLLEHAVTTSLLLAAWVLLLMLPLPRGGRAGRPAARPIRAGRATGGDLQP